MYFDDVFCSVIKMFPLRSETDNSLSVLEVLHKVIVGKKKTIAKQTTKEKKS